MSWEARFLSRMIFQPQVAAAYESPVELRDAAVAWLSAPPKNIWTLNMRIGIVWAFSLQQFGISTATWLFLKFDLVPVLNVSCSFCRRWAEGIPGCGSERFERNEETKHQLYKWTRKKRETWPNRRLHGKLVFSNVSDWVQACFGPLSGERCELLKKEKGKKNEKSRGNHEKKWTGRLELHFYHVFL